MRRMFWALSPVNPQGAACSLRILNRHLPDDRCFKMGFCANGGSGWPGGCPSQSARASPASRWPASSALLPRATMSQKSSLPQVTRFVSRSLPPDSNDILRRLQSRKISAVYGPRISSVRCLPSKKHLFANRCR